MGIMADPKEAFDMICTGDVSESRLSGERDILENNEAWIF